MFVGLKQDLCYDNCIVHTGFAAEVTLNMNEYSGLLTLEADVGQPE